MFPFIKDMNINILSSGQHNLIFSNCLQTKSSIKLPVILFCSRNEGPLLIKLCNSVFLAISKLPVITCPQLVHRETLRNYSYKSY